MKNFFKILLSFLIIFTIGVCVTYISINNTFKKIDKEELVSTPTLSKFQKYISIKTLVY
ncbi:MAG: hypothetical protein R2821_08110 [Flavobacteriaceae bacterium]|jgi:hypothetical protein